MVAGRDAEHALLEAALGAARLDPSVFDEVALVGEPDRIADRLQAWKESGVTSLLVQAHDPATLRTMAELVL